MITFYAASSTSTRDKTNLEYITDIYIYIYMYIYIYIYMREKNVYVPVQQQLNHQQEGKM